MIVENFITIQFFYKVHQKCNAILKKFSIYHNANIEIYVINVIFV